MQQPPLSALIRRSGRTDKRVTRVFVAVRLLCYVGQAVDEGSRQLRSCRNALVVLRVSVCSVRKFEKDANRGGRVGWSGLEKLAALAACTEAEPIGVDRQFTPGKHVGSLVGITYRSQLRCSTLCVVCFYDYSKRL